MPAASRKPYGANSDSLARGDTRQGALGPKIYLRDTGILHHLLTLRDHHALLAHPRVGASWEGFVVEQALAMLRFPEAPRVTKSMRVALEDLRLSHLYVIYPGAARFPADERITMWPAKDLAALPGEMG